MFDGQLGIATAYVRPATFTTQRSHDHLRAPQRGWYTLTITAVEKSGYVYDAAISVIARTILE